MNYSEAKVGQKVFICQSAYRQLGYSQIPSSLRGVLTITIICDDTQKCCGVRLQDGKEVHISLLPLRLCN